MDNILFLIEDEGWNGGVNYVQNIIKFINKYHKNLNPILLIPKDSSKNLITNLNRLNIRYQSVDFISKKKSKFIFNLKSILFIQNQELIKIIKKNNIKYAFEITYFLGWKINGVKIYSWIPDFQHLLLSKNFTVLGILYRQILILIKILAKRNFIFSSNSDKYFFKKNFTNKIPCFILNFAVETQEINIKDTNNILKKYNIDRSFYLLPNQYWKHKNHVLVINSLNKLINTNILILSTGNTNGLSEKLSKIIKINNSLNYRVLGEIPYQDYLHLLSKCKALINPSFFEGWSTSVEEAKSFSKKCILSNISIHREQFPEAIFFNPYCSNDFIKKLIDNDIKFSRGEFLYDNGENINRFNFQIEQLYDFNNNTNLQFK
jgi:hypothetical protein